MDKLTEENPVGEPRQPLAPPCLVKSPPPNEFWKGFLDLTGGSILYCLSALSIIYGLTQIMGPLLLKTGVLGETLPCIGALNLYELALLGTLAFIVVWRNVTDDAISLVVLIPLFLIGSGISLDTVANNGPALALWIGVACAVLGGVKLAVLRRSIRVPFGRLALGGLLLVVLWNFLAGPALVKLFVDHPDMMASKRSFWLGGLLLLVIAGTLVLIEMIRNPGPSIGGGSPFLRTVPMVSVFVLVLLGAAGAHQYALGYQFDVRSGDGDFMLLGTLGVILLLETMLHSGFGMRQEVAVFSCAPLVGTAIVLGYHGFVAPFQWGLELLGHPSTVLAVGGYGVVRMAWQTRWAPYWWIAGVYGLAVVLTGFSPSSPEEFNWRLCFGILVVFLFVLGVMMKRPNFCVAAVVIGSIGLASSSHFTHAVKVMGLTVQGGVAGVFGLGMLGVVAAFKDKTLIPLAVLGAAAFVGSVFDFLAEAIGWRDLLVVFITAGVAGLVWWRLRNLLVVVILGAPVAARLWLLFRTLSTWRYVVLSFVLLGVGAWLSTVKSRKMKPVEATVDEDDEGDQS